MNNFKTHLESLLQLAICDHRFAKAEETLIYSIGKANKIPEQEIRDMIQDNLVRKEVSELNFGMLTFDEKFEYLYNIVQLMKIDHEVFLSEIRFGEALAEKLGFNKGVIRAMSTRVFSDPSITADREQLRLTVKKFEL